MFLNRKLRGPRSCKRGMMKAEEAEAGEEEQRKEEKEEGEKQKY